MVEINNEEYNEFLKYKQRKYSETNKYPQYIKWENIVFKYNPYLSKGNRNSSDVKAFVKRYPTQKGINIQLQVWYGKTLYLFDVLDATDTQRQYNLDHNIRRI
jgi:hypothetical protein